jgi:O-antigen/teichoic acid export membrane protein
MIPLLMHAPKEGLSELKTRTRRLMHFLFPVTIVLLFVTRPLFPVVFNPEFKESAALFNIYLLLTASRVLLPNAIVLARGFPAAILQVGVVELILKIVLGFAFIYTFGLHGLAWSVVLAFWMEKGALIWFLEKKQGLRTSEWLDVRWYVIYTMALLAAFLLSHYV